VNSFGIVIRIEITFWAREHDSWRNLSRTNILIFYTKIRLRRTCFQVMSQHSADCSSFHPKLDTIDATLHSATWKYLWRVGTFLYEKKWTLLSKFFWTTHNAKVMPMPNRNEKDSRGACPGYLMNSFPFHDLPRDPGLISSV